MAQQLPPGWAAQWDPQHNRNLYIDTTTNRSQWEPPTGPAGGLTGQHGQPAPNGAAMAGQQTGAGGRGTPSTSAPGPARSKRQYAANQNELYYGNQQNYGQGTAQQGNDQGQFFSPAAQAGLQPPLASPGTLPGANRMPTAPYGQQQPAQNGAPQSGFPFNPTAGYSQPSTFQPAFSPQQQPQGSVAGVTNSFAAMNVANRLVSNTTNINLIGLPLNPIELNIPPPLINLPQGCCISDNPRANADPSYMRSTINAIPTTNSLLQKSKVPFALVLTPYRSVGPDDDEVPVVTDTVIARCRRCRTYINPYVTFIESGNRWKCCMCSLSNEVPQLFDWDQQTNQPADRWNRVELNHSVVEFVAPSEYMVRPPQPPVYVFLIDVSYAAIRTGMVATAARTLLESLDRLPNEGDRAKISIIAIDTCLHFFSVNPGATEPNMLVVGDLDEIFLPKPADILLNLTEARAGIESLLGRLNDMFKDTHSVGSALGPALQAAYKLISGVGGKIFVLSATLPSLGPGALKNREDPKLLGTSKESSLLQAAAGGFYKGLAIDCSRTQISVDMWLFTSAYTDVATLSSLPRYTGGATFFYPAFDAGRSEDALKFAHEFANVVTSPVCLEAVMRVRASKGLRMSACHGNFFVRSTDLLALPAVPIDQSYCIEMQIEDPIAAPIVVLQTAVLHTTSFGERRIRVITLALPTTASISEVFATVDQSALVTLLANKAVERCMQAKLEDARDALQNKLIDILSSLKSVMASSGPSPQLLASENMKHLPLLILGLLKHVGLRQSSTIPSDLRSYAQALLTTLPTQLLIPYLHPQLYSLHNMPSECGTVGEHGVIMPLPLPASSERLERHGLFLIEDGQNLFLWIGRDAVPKLVNDVFDLPTYHSLAGGKITLPQLENDFNKRVNAVIGKVRESRRGPYWPHLYLVKEDGDPSLRMWALSMLIEDRAEHLPSYAQWLGQIKDKVNAASS
ncbi:uncharacterized protein L969DRAFT_48143 [Mixia osmundae IAM 14324]|uniref:WW domain-containing protein n=1 Tax=Mixia osmundae (strain CBS 9802 / IAM 14324 / JCM 22182 / KY 12970) TaxID=764103 RepID=G7E9D0_MIXOS|nr:uncharacterized protein L969DRAFT_48143 [Mixia osmundae IAM 14324]KEI39879.1 hypothetical protein L969DRAFT_48143 [Mixia osmundae IAM 14324]GAA99249.1 hypothetical protein E5Q_05943 [Mixia osmundae IAM 14324]